MSQSLTSLENAVQKLGRDELAAFRDWFNSFEAAQWDAQIERDVASGKLDKLTSEGIREYEAGATRAL